MITDAYSRAIDRNAPTWKWGYWGEPPVIEITPAGKRAVRYDLAGNLANARAFVRLDATGEERPFDGDGDDSTGSEFRLADLASGSSALPHASTAHARRAIAAFPPHRDGVSGTTIAEYRVE